MTRDELIAALEQAEVGSREFDVAIHKAFGHKATNEKALAPDQIESWFRTFALDYTTSLDAAQTLVPEGWVLGWRKSNTKRLWRSTWQVINHEQDYRSPAT